MTSFSNWLYNTALSSFLRDVTWIIPLVQTIHIIALSCLFTSAAVFGAQVLVRNPDKSYLAQLAARFLPWVLHAVLILFITGVTLVIAEPERALGNYVFLLKMCLVFLAVLNTFYIQSMILPLVFLLNSDGSKIERIRAHSGLAIIFWVAIIIAGRFIAYT